jgi:preprotein translocase subunit YajC
VEKEQEGEQAVVAGGISGTLKKINENMYAYRVDPAEMNAVMNR